MGDHTDYNEGFVLPAAIGLECIVGARVHDGPVALETLNDVEPEWSRYVDAVVAALADRGRPDVAIEGLLGSSVPSGSGLSSSAALEVAIALALCDAAGFELDPVQLAVACQDAEHRATGVPSGIMDQLASLCGRAQHALLVDCRTFEIAHVRVPDEIALLVVHSGVPRKLETSEYAVRRSECERIADSLGLPALRDATMEQVADEPLARHVVGENARVHATVEALGAGNLARLGELFLESHASLRDDYRVSIPELDALVDALVESGAAGARLTGAGFGGCAVAVAERDRAAEILARTVDAYEPVAGRRVPHWVCEPSAGAGPFERAR